MASDSDILFNLRADTNLLDPNFDRYILRNESISTWKKEFDKSVRHKLPSARQWGYEQIKAHTLTDRLVVDQFQSNPSTSHFYIILENQSLISIIFDHAAKLWSDPIEVARLSQASIGEDAFPESLHFLNENFAITSNGTNAFTIWETGLIRKSGPWKELYSSAYGKLRDTTSDPAPAIILDTRQGDKNKFDVLFLTVSQIEKMEEEKLKGDEEEIGSRIKANNCFQTHLIWVNIEQKNDEFIIQRLREVECANHVEFACFDTTLQHLVVFGAVERKPRFVWDSASQKSEEFINHQEIDGQKSLDEAGIDTDAEKKPIEQQEMQPMATEDTSPAFNAEQLEECDRTPEDEITATFWLDGESHQLVKMTILNELLFTVRFNPTMPPAFVSRYDVDAIVWALEDVQQLPLKHLFTLNAFGFIQAGHQDKRFLGCSPDGHYVVLINRINHVFFYLQISMVSKEHELKNRRTNKRAESVAKQVILSMASSDPDYKPNEANNEFLGFFASSETLFLLTHNSIYAAEVPK